MQKRTTIRTTFDIIFNNAIIKTIASFVNFCYEQCYFNQKKLKFLKKIPLNNVETSELQNQMLFKVTK